MIDVVRLLGMWLGIWISSPLITDAIQEARAAQLLANEPTVEILVTYSGLIVMDGESRWFGRGIELVRPFTTSIDGRTVTVKPGQLVWRRWNYSSGRPEIVIGDR